MGLAAGVRRIGVYGGAFDPPHAAHLAVARAAIEQLALDELRVIPTGDAWHKSRPLSPARDRLALCRLAFDGWPRVVVDDRELRRAGPTYTIDTLGELRAQHPRAELFLVIGSDQAGAFARWRQADQIASLATIAIAGRADPQGASGQFDMKNPLPGLKLGDARAVRQLRLPAMAHSSTAIRARVAGGRAIARLVPAAVARYIAEHHLYQSQSMSETAAKKDVQKLQRAIVDGLEDVKGHDIRVFNTEHLSPLFERVIVASGNSNRQTKALAASVQGKVREAGFAKPRLEGEDNGEWIIVDCGAAVAHVMQPVIRQYYNLEEIWGEKPVRLRSAAPAVAKATSRKAATPKAAAKLVPGQPATGAKAAAAGKTTGARAAKAAQADPDKSAAPRKTAAGKTSARKTAASKPAASKPAASKAGGAAAPGRKTSARKPARQASGAQKVLVVGKSATRAAGKSVAKAAGKSVAKAAGKSVAKAAAGTAGKAPARAPTARKAAPARKSAKHTAR